MKTLVIIVTVLALTIAVYSFNVTRLQKFTNDFLKCNEELGKSPAQPTVEATMCATIRDGEVLNANHEYIRSKALQRFEDIISDPDKLAQTKATYNKCYDDVVRTGITGEAQTVQVIKCALPMIFHVDQPQYIPEGSKMKTLVNIVGVLAVTDTPFQIFNANGEYIKELTIKGLEDVISDAATLGKAQAMFTNCYDNLQLRYTNIFERFKMKTLVIIVSVLFVVTTVYGKNEARLKIYYANYAKCLKEKGGTADKPSLEAIVCVMEKDGDALNANGEYTREKAMKGIEDAISDPSTIQKAKAMYNKCHDEVEQSGATGHEQALKISSCVMPVLALFDKI
ncbi:uncharacterized protein LOC116853103 [Odontomachus brunneus]|uniref:uncharacterized protein LOC116853103 n=1 Tax=Odontomachus brunneus TaxID=486640 RepID=UPI0013F293D8|nr:uncharacterized protein LOC116853103 [Odontomachus brunneus]